MAGGKAGAAWVTAGLIGVAVLINLIGFVLAAGLLFACRRGALAVVIRCATWPSAWP